MKRIYLVIAATLALILATLSGFSQTKTFLSYDSVFIRKSGNSGPATLIISNSTKNATNGVLYNLGQGVTGFETPYMIDDSTLHIAGIDLVIKGGTSGPTNTFSNGLTESDGAVKLGGELTQETHITSSDKIFNIETQIAPVQISVTEGSLGVGLVTVQNAQVELQGASASNRKSSFDVTGNDGTNWRYFNDTLAMSRIRQDATGQLVKDDIHRKGLKNESDYSDNIILDNNALTSTRAVKRLISDSLSGTGRYIKNDTTITQNGGFKLGTGSKIQTDTLKIGYTATGLSTDSVLVKGTDGVVRKVAQNSVGVINYKWVEQFDDGIIGSNQVNGINKTFVLSATPVIGDSTFVFINGIKQVAGQNYTLSGTILTLVDTPAKKSIISVTYRNTTAQTPTTRYNTSSINNIVFYGNSLFYGTGAVPGFSDVVSQLKNYFPNIPFLLINRGIPGQPTTFLNTNITDSLVPYLNSSYATNTIVVTEGVNDMAFGASPTVAYSHLKTLCQNIKALNPSYKVVICTILPTTSYVSNSSIAQVNDSIIANYTQFADTLVNTTTNNQIGQSGNNLNKNYYRNDGLHLFPEGYNIYASLIYPPTILKAASIVPQNVTKVILPTNDLYIVNGGNYNVLADSVGFSMGNVRNYNLNLKTNDLVRARIDSTGKINLIPSLTATGNTTGILLSPTITGNVSGVIYDGVTINGFFSNGLGHTENLLKIAKSTDSLVTIGAVTGTASLYPFKLFNTSLITPSLNINTDLNTSNFTVGGIVFQNGAATTGNATVIGSISQDLIYNTANNKNHLFKISNTTALSVGSSNQVTGPYANNFVCTGTGTFPFSTKTGIIWSAPGGTGNDILIGRDGNNLYYKTHSAGSHNFTQGDNIKLYVASNIGVNTTTTDSILTISGGENLSGGLKVNGAISINTTGPAGFGLNVNRSVAINKDSATIVGSITNQSVAIIDTTTGQIKRISASALPNFYNTDGTLTGNRTITMGSNYLNFTGSVGIGTASPAARLHLPAGAGGAGTAPLIFTSSSGTVLAGPVDGAVEYDGANLFFTSAGPVRYTLAKTLTNTATLDFPSTAAGTKSDLTVSVVGASSGDVVSIGVPGGSVPGNGTFFGWVSASNTVTIRFANNDITNSFDPASGTFRVSVIKY